MIFFLQINEEKQRVTHFEVNFGAKCQTICTFISVFLKTYLLLQCFVTPLQVGSSIII